MRRTRRSSWSRSTSASQASVKEAAAQILAVARVDRPARQQRRRDGHPGAQDRRRLRDAVRRRPPRPLDAHRAAAARAAAYAERADRHRHQHRAPHGPRRRPEEPAPRGPLRAVEVPTGRRSSPTSTSGSACSASSTQAGAGATSLIAHPGLSNTDLQAVSVEETGGEFAASASSRSSRSEHRDVTPPTARCRSCAPRPTRPPRAASSTGRSASTTGRPVRKPIFRRLGMSRGDRASSGRSPSARPGSRSTSVRQRDVDGRPTGRRGPAALRALVAERGFHGASMSAVASAAGVATGTAYTHYASKDELVLAAYLETKAELGARRPRASIRGRRPGGVVPRRSGWRTYRHLARQPRPRALPAAGRPLPVPRARRTRRSRSGGRPADRAGERGPTSPSCSCRFRRTCSTSSASGPRSASLRAGWT